MMKRFSVMVIVATAFQNGLVDLDIEYGSIPRERIEISLVMIRYVQYPTDHTHLKPDKRERKSLVMLI